jgi:hypothetical protein
MAWNHSDIVAGRGTGDYCDTIVSGWLNKTNNNISAFTTAQNCSSCEIEVMQYQLNSSLGYDSDVAKTFSSLTSSCGATTYTWATPTTYALNATAVATSAVKCSNSTKAYVIQSNDTCVTISGATSVSTYGLINTNQIDIACNSLPAVGGSICLPSTCSTYQLQYVDTCDSLVSSLNITKAQLLAWNPNINTGCSNLASWRGWYLCHRFVSFYL